MAEFSSDLTPGTIGFEHLRDVCSEVGVRGRTGAYHSMPVTLVESTMNHQSSGGMEWFYADPNGRVRASVLCVPVNVTTERLEVASTPAHPDFRQIAVPVVGRLIIGYWRDGLSEPESQVLSGDEPEQLEFLPGDQLQLHGVPTAGIAGIGAVIFLYPEEPLCTIPPYTPRSIERFA